MRNASAKPDIVGDLVAERRGGGVVMGVREEVGCFGPELGG